MHILVISDTHLCANFEYSKYLLLEKLIQQADRVILNGDFWEGYAVYFDQFMNSPWKTLFPLLKRKRAIYIYGNHDKKSFCDIRVDDFSDQNLLRYELNLGERHLIFEHGNRVAFKIDDKLHIVRPNTLVFRLLDFFQKVFIQILGLKGFWLLFGHLNQEAKDAMKEELKNDPSGVYVFGHTHCQEIDLQAKIANSGIFKYGFAQYLTIDEKGEITAHSERY